MNLKIFTLAEMSASVLATTTTSFFICRTAKNAEKGAEKKRTENEKTWTVALGLKQKKSWNKQVPQFSSLAKTWN